MDINKSIFDVFREDSIISLNEFKSIKEEDYDILIVPSTGAWSVLPKQKDGIINYLSTPKTIYELKNSNNCDDKELIDELFYSGLLKINGKDVAMVKRMEMDKHYNTPSLLILKYTNACNLKCDYCYYYDEKFNWNEKLSNEDVYRTIELINNIDASNKLTVCFHGGEPLLRFNDIVKCVSEIKRRKYNVDFSIMTNGTLLTSEVAKYLNEENFSIGISIDGYDEETNKLRTYSNKRTSIYKVLTAIDNCITAGTIPGTISVLTKNNCHRAIDIIENLSLKGITKFHFNFFFPGGRGENKQEYMAVPIDDLYEIRLKMLLYINDYNINKPSEKHISERFTRNLIQKLSQIGPLEYMCSQSPCGSGRKILTLTPNGDLYPCDDFSTDPLFKIGTVNEITNLYKTLKESKSVRMCQSHCIENIPKCRACTFRRMCISHCCSDSYHYTGKFNSPHYICDFVKKFIPTVIDLLYKDRIQVENF